MAYDPFGGRNGSYNNGGGGYRYGDVGSQRHGAGGSGMGGGEYDMDDMDNTYPPHTHTSHPQSFYDMDPSMDQSIDMGGAPGNNGLGVPKDEFDPFTPPPKSTGDLRMWRQDHRGNLWNKGSRPACIGRFFCCSLMTIVLLFVSIILTLAIFLRPPDINFDGLAPVDPSTIKSSSDSLNATLGIQISVKNPNYLDIDLKAIKVKLTYPINNTEIGGGEKDKISFHSNTQTDFNFPLTLGYSKAADPDGNVLRDIAAKCGFVPGSAKSKLEVDYMLTISVAVIGVTVSVPLNGNVDFDCPFSLQDIKPLVAAFPALQGIIGS